MVRFPRWIHEIKPVDLGNVQSGVSGTFFFFFKGPSTDLTLHVHAASVNRATLIREDMLDAYTQGTQWNGNNRALVEVSLKAGLSPAPRVRKAWTASLHQVSTKTSFT